MVKNLRKGSKVSIKIGKRSLFRSPGVVVRVENDFVDVKTNFGILMRKSSEVKRRK